MYYSIEYRGQILDINGNLESATPGDYETPPTPASFEVYKIKLGNYDITELIGDDTSEIEELIFEQLID